ncbi:MAG: cell division protein FtsA [Candidatus Kapaibacterium sp.]|nr:cell division protein FtsA [Ignavibacteriota bacterium]MCB9222423.1 cell division protein FtsA [Ignavibacteria bacterium]
MSSTLNNGLPISVGLDIGTSKICALVTSPDPTSNTLKILGIGIAESEGLNRGVVVNIEKTIRSIKKVIEQAEEQSGIKIKEVTVGIAGDHIEAIKTRGIIGISNSEQEITQNDVDRLLKDASKIAIPSERKILHVIPQDFIIDGQDGITDPIGMSGIRMEANVNIITGLKTAINNIYRCVERLDIKVKDVILEPIASSKSVLLDAEKEIGVAIVDIGGGTTDVAIFEEGVYRFTSVFALAGKHVTNDIRKVLGIVTNQAEKIKRDYGHCHGNSIMKDEVFMVPGIGGRKPMELQKSQLCEIIQPRMQELFEFALAEINRSGYANNLGAGIVVTGGTALLNGTEELAKEVFGMPVKIGIPTNLSYSGLAPEVSSPVYSTAVGLALNGIGDINSFEIEDLTNEVEIEEEAVVVEKTEKVVNEAVKESTVKNLFSKKSAKKEKTDKKGKSVTSTFSYIKNFIEEL